MLERKLEKSYHRRHLGGCAGSTREIVVLDVSAKMERLSVNELVAL